MELFLLLAARRLSVVCGGLPQGGASQLSVLFGFVLFYFFIIYIIIINTSALVGIFPFMKCSIQCHEDKVDLRKKHEPRLLIGPLSHIFNHSNVRAEFNPLCSHVHACVYVCVRVCTCVYVCVRVYVITH